MYGQLGILSYDEIEDKVQCHICGRWFRSVASHVNKSHGWSADDYREEFGLNKGQSLICEGTREKLSILNKRLGTWKHLPSQTLTKDQLKQFLRRVHEGVDYDLRRQTLLKKSENLKIFNPMNEPEVVERKLAKQHETWYGTPKQRALSKVNIQKAINTIRDRNLRDRKWVCKCGQSFHQKSGHETPTSSLPWSGRSQERARWAPV